MELSEEQIRILLQVDQETAHELWRTGGDRDYRYYRDALRHLVIEYGITLPLNCLQFMYYQKFQYQFSWKQ